MPLHVSRTCAHHEEVKIGLHSLWYHHTYRWPFRARDDTRECVMQFWPPDDRHICSKHVEAWNKFIVKQKFCASIWIITEINLYVVVCLVTVYTINCIWKFIPADPIPVCGAYSVNVWREWCVNIETRSSAIRNRYC